MTYNNLATQVTSVSGTWSGAAISFSTLGLSTSIPFKDQIEVERIFSSAAFTAVKDNITTSDLHKIFLLEKTEYTITGNNISAFSMNGTRSYTLTGGSSSGTAIPIPAISNGDSVIIRRKTLSIDTYVTWAPGTKLTTTQLNQQVGQLLRLNQELMYKMDSEYVRAADLSGSVAPVIAVNNNLNMNSFQILNLAAPSSAGDGVNKNYVDTNFVNKSTAQTGIAGAKTFTGAMTLSSGLTVDTNTLVVDATNDRVGIGTSSPTGKLHVVGNTKVTSGTAGGVQSDITNMSGIHLDGGISASSTSSILYSSGGGGGAAMSFLRNDAYLTGIALSTNNASSANTTTERMRIDWNGNVGIGTTSPGYKLSVSSTSGLSGFASDGTVQQAFAYPATTLAYAGTLTNHPYAFIVNNSEQMRIDTSGRVGIGLGNPATKLHVSGSSAAHEQIYLANSSSSSFLQMVAAGTSGATGAGIPANSVWFEGAPASSGNTYLSSYNNNLAFVTGSSRLERMRIDTNGNLLLGATSVNTNASFSNGLKLEITTASTEAAVGLYHYGDSDAGNAIRSFRAKGSKASPTALVSGNILGSIRGLGYNGSAFTAQTGGMDIVTTENWTTGANGTAIAFNTTPNGSAAASMTERMRIGNDGKVGIGTNSPSETLHVNGTSKFVGTITADSSVNASSLSASSSISTSGLVQAGTGVSPSAGASAAGLCATLASTPIGIYVTTAAPSFAAAKGSLCINTGGGASTLLYVCKTANTATTGAWSAVTSS